MKSALAVSFAIDAPEELIAELVGQIQRKLPSIENGCAILMIEPLCDIDEIVPTLSTALGIPVIGCTSSAQLSSLGYHTNSATLLVLSDPDCNFGVAITDPITQPEQAPEQIAKAFNAANEQLDGKELGCIFAFSARANTVANELRVKIISDLGHGKPIFGGVAADYFTFTNDVVFFNGTSVKGGIVLLLVGGDIHPTFIVRNLPPSRLAQHTITKSTNNVLQAIDGLTTAEFLLNKDFDISSAGLLHAPLRVTLKDEESGKSEEYIRHIISIDPETGFGNVSSDLPEGTELAMQFVQPSDIIASTTEVMHEAAKAVNAINSKSNGHKKVSTAFCVSCAARHVILGTDATKEGALAADIFGEDINFAGFYSMGEFCPSFIWEGKAKNRLHQLSIVVCLI